VQRWPICGQDTRREVPHHVPQRPLLGGPVGLAETGRLHRLDAEPGGQLRQAIYLSLLSAHPFQLDGALSDREAGEYTLWQTATAGRLSEASIDTGISDCGAVIWPCEDDQYYQKNNCISIQIKG
jgi:hypothetical protein